MHQALKVTADVLSSILYWPERINKHLKKIQKKQRIQPSLYVTYLKFQPHVASIVELQLLPFLLKDM